MPCPPLVRRWLSAAALSLALLSPLIAQNALYTEYGGKMCLVRGARGNRPLVQVGDKRVAAEGLRFVLKPVEEFLPVFIAVRNVGVSTSYATVEGSGARVNHQLEFRARFETLYPLDDVFVMLDLRGAEAGRVLLLYEVGRLEPRDPKPILVFVPMEFALGSGRFQLHIFVGGAEVMHSEIPVAEREAALDRMIVKRIEPVQDGALKLFIGPAPDYPEKLRKANVSGNAVVAVRVTTSGRPLDVTVKSATDPAFGEAAVAAVRQWRFLPVVKSGRPMETLAEIPFVFTPPPKSEK